MDKRSTSTEEMDAAIATLKAHKDQWAALPARPRIEVIDALIEDFGALNEEWVAVSLEAKASSEDAYAAGLEWSGGPLAVLRYLRLLRRALVDIQKRGRPALPSAASVNLYGQVMARIYPQNMYERVTTMGVTAEIWMAPRVGLDELADTQAVHYQGQQAVDTPARGKIVLVLGAGNISGLPVNDSLSKLFVENAVVLLKMNPVNDYLGPLIERSFRQLIEAGYFGVVYGGAKRGAYLCNHADIDEIHMTGSDKTYEAIVFGDGEEGALRKKERQPLVSKRFTAELGNIAPAIVVPGPWSQEDIAYQAEQIASHLCDNAGYSCSRTRVILQYAGWGQRQELLEAIRAALAKIPPRPAYYPGGSQLYQRFLAAHPEGEQFGPAEEGKLQWALIPGIDPSQHDDICLTTESFCPVVAETALPAKSAANFIDQAVEYANQHIWGTLTATIIIHPRSLKDPAVQAALERALVDLRYGIVTINCLPGLAWALISPPWGSFPGNKPWNIQSGTGFVHNPFMFSKPQKTILQAPFRASPKPVWFPSQAQVFAKVTRKIAAYERQPSLGRLLGILWTAMRG